FQAEDGIRDRNVTGVQTCALPISRLVLDALDRTRLAPGAREAVERVEYETRDGAKLALNLCISYSSRAELARAARLLAEDVLKRSEERRVGKGCRVVWGGTE